jgi:hypothetical protein
MPYEEPDSTDPQELIGVLLPADPGAMREMAYAFAEEFARLGHDRARILWMFRTPFYAGAHGVYRALGAAVTTAIVDECVAVWGRVRAVDHDAPADTSAGFASRNGPSQGEEPDA